MSSKVNMFADIYILFVDKFHGTNLVIMVTRTYPLNGYAVILKIFYGKMTIMVINVSSSKPYIYECCLCMYSALI